MADIAVQIELTEKIMQLWDRVLPGRVLRLPYETIISDQETASRRLLEHCGLEWDPRVLDFHSSKRPVQTASLAQVGGVYVGVGWGGGGGYWSLSQRLGLESGYLTGMLMTAKKTAVKWGCECVCGGGGGGGAEWYWSLIRRLGFNRHTHDGKNNSGLVCV